jgi:hypothetical protein
VTAGQIEDAPATETSAGTSSHLPSLVQLLARDALGLAQRASHSLEERVPFEATEIVARKTGTAAGVEAHGAA